MYNEAIIRFTNDCKTWVVTRGQKEDQLRFRASPLHAALVFGAPDDLVMKIYNSYPLAAGGCSWVCRKWSTMQVMIVSLLIEGNFAKQRCTCANEEGVTVRNPLPHFTKSKGLVLGSVIQRFKSNGQLLMYDFVRRGGALSVAVCKQEICIDFGFI